MASTICEGVAGCVNVARDLVDDVANEATAARGAKGDHRTGLNQVPNIA
jgi:hypothetical protein